MKKLLILICVIFLFSSVYSQDKKVNIKKNFGVKIDMFSDIWMDIPDDINTKTINRGCDIYGMYNYPIKKSNFSFAIGFGIGIHNMYSNTIAGVINDSTIFGEIPDSISYKKSKISVTYFDIPIEFRLKTKGKLTIAAGFKAGYLINKHSKYKGKDTEGSNIDIIQKTNDIRNLETIRFGPTLRVGYGWFNLSAYYSLSKLFVKDKGPEIYPISVGITLAPF
ncbi:MAG: PorT family protein [Bacteroidales bacterium]|nr:PorT family protein [Bacteroidales bacterium]